MWWLWLLGPVTVAFIYFLTGLPDNERLRELEIWRKSWGPLQGKKPIGAKRVGSVPSDLLVLVDEVGGGPPLGVFELVPRDAYLGVFGPSAASGSEHQTIVARLADPGPTFTARPLPRIDGERVQNSGVQFRKDEAFTDAYLVEGVDARALKVWLSPPVREQLLDMPELWLRVRGRVMALTLYGRADAERLDDLVAAADVIFAEYGAIDASLLGPDVAPESGPPSKKKQKKDVAGPPSGAKHEPPKSSKRT